MNSKAPGSASTVRQASRDMPCPMVRGAACRPEWPSTIPRRSRSCGSAQAILCRLVRRSVLWCVPKQPDSCAQPPEQVGGTPALL